MRRPQGPPLRHRPATQSPAPESLRFRVHPVELGPSSSSRRRPTTPRADALPPGCGVQVMRWRTVAPPEAALSPSRTILPPLNSPVSSNTVPPSSTQVWRHLCAPASNMLRLVPCVPLAPVHSSRSAQPPRMTLTRLWPAALPSGFVTSQSPSQKSNCRCCGVAQGLGAGVDCGGGSDAAPTSPTVRARTPRAVGEGRSSAGPPSAQQYGPDTARARSGTSRRLRDGTLSSGAGTRGT